MAEAPEPIHYVARGYKSLAALTDRMDASKKEAANVFREEQDLYTEKWDNRHLHEKSIVRSSLVNTIDQVLQDYETQLKQKHGDKYEDHMSTTFHHLDYDERKKHGRETANKFAKALTEIVGGTKLREFYEKNPELLDRFVEKEFQAFNTRTFAIHSLEDLARAFSEETTSLRAIFSGEAEARDSEFAKLINAYLNEVTSVAHNRRVYQTSSERYINHGTGENYRHFLGMLNAQFEKQNLGYTAGEALDKGTAHALWRSSAKRGFAVPEQEIVGLEKAAPKEATRRAA